MGGQGVGMIGRCCRWRRVPQRHMGPHWGLPSTGCSHWKGAGKPPDGDCKTCSNPTARLDVILGKRLLSRGLDITSH